MGRTACAEPQCLYKGALYFFNSCNTRNIYRNPALLVLPSRSDFVLCFMFARRSKVMMVKDPEVQDVSATTAQNSFFLLRFKSCVFLNESSAVEANRAVLCKMLWRKT
jgi:hypothetical protein